MEFVEVMKCKRRMCNSVGVCWHCPLFTNNNGSNIICEEFIRTYPEKAEEIIMKWAKENPVKTNRQVLEEVLKEKFGDIFDVSEFDCRLLKQNCPKNNIPCEKCDIDKFWNKEYEEVEKDAIGN